MKSKVVKATFDLKKKKKVLSPLWWWTTAGPESCLVFHGFQESAEKHKWHLNHLNF